MNSWTDVVVPALESQGFLAPMHLTNSKTGRKEIVEKRVSIECMSAESLRTMRHT
ncbi:unannotated protein [freshwater metagenome]|uniref:Unannotated protein n=1 Tax=freshwater metagenome TaxID=449393 RepID=A0A6J6RBC6_9ZZZZ